MTLQQAQTEAILALLNLNNPADTSSNVTSSGKHGSGAKTPQPTGPPVWKILVLDQQTKDVLATVLRVQDLRDVGVTLHVYVILPEYYSMCLYRLTVKYTHYDHHCLTYQPSTSFPPP